MTETTYENTIDWETFWREAEGDRRRSANVGQYGNADLLTRLFDRFGVPERFASFGCGPAAPIFDLAERYPNVAFRGYNAVESIIETNRERADEKEVDNATFDVSVLPEIAIGQKFDIVYCYATLQYVADIELAITALYDRVRTGGFLVFDYPNTLSHARMWRMVEESSS